MDRIQSLEDIWDNGAISSSSLSGEEIDHFKISTNAQRVVARRWIYQGKQYQTPYFARLLPDGTGLVHYENNDPRNRRLMVLNGDTSERTITQVPHVDSDSKPRKGYLSLPPSALHFGGIEWGCEGNDGNTDYLFDFDWNTGALIRHARPLRPW